ncbi:MAG: aminotransferase class I/II-fold pyridoxal phosphate-dependent enzyme [Gemmatimonadetes bacterium]|nr:aminotransferase class I/II-fold pyridoxal phosphate-dependent enzyme [Gemmatimonadota bacterium]
MAKSRGKRAKGISAPAQTHGPSTLGIHGHEPPREVGDPVAPVIVQSATFLNPPSGGGGLLYTRYGNNPNQEAVSAKLAALEGTEAAIVLASGMAAISLTLLALTKAGDHIVASRFVYGWTQRLLEEEMPLRGMEVTFVDPWEKRVWREALRPRTRVLYVEVPTNPTLRVFDPSPLSKLAREHGIAVVVDATFASPINMRPAAHGADVVIHSATKYLGGHSDLIAGVVCASRGVIDEIQSKLKLYGPAIDPHAAWLLDRGLRTLAVRIARHNENALALARWFATRDGVQRVIYPGLPEHPDHAEAARLMSGFGGMLSIVLAGGDAAADRFCEALTLAVNAPSLGGVETLVSQPRHTSHSSLTAAERAAIDIPPGFVRISVGTEDVEDLMADFDMALNAATAA